MDGAGLTMGLLQGREPVGVAGLWGRRLVSTISWQAEVCGFVESNRGRLDEDVLGGWIEETMWKPSLRICLNRGMPR